MFLETLDISWNMVRVAKTKFEADHSRAEEVEERRGGGNAYCAKTKDMVRQHIRSFPRVSFSVTNPIASSRNTSSIAKYCDPILQPHYFQINTLAIWQLFHEWKGCRPDTCTVPSPRKPIVLVYGDYVELHDVCGQCLRQLRLNNLCYRFRAITADLAPLRSTTSQIS